MSALRKSFLSGTALAAVLVICAAAHAADATPAPLQDATSGLILGDIAAEFGSQAFITKPGTGVSNNSAKFNQYGDRTEPVFLNSFNGSAKSADGTYKVDAYGQNVGTNAQAYELDLSRPGVQSFSYAWTSTPNLRSNSAETIFQGVGTNNLTVPNALITTLNTAGGKPGAAYPATGTTAAAQAAAAAHVTTIQNDLAPYQHQIDLGIQHDRQDVQYKWDLNDEWTLKVDYSHDHRYGIQEQGFLFSSSTSTPLAQAPTQSQESPHFQDDPFGGISHEKWGERIAWEAATS